ncbi:MAG: hypothetical protein DRH37_02450 [Deltaproteobacteria bacterium]|nr:MAG: hypothetical protein DRH37_02450 [Deltaproteobacteria bacterium]
MKDDGSNWRAYQKKLQREQRRKTLLQAFPSMILYSGCAILVLMVVCFGWVWISEYRSQASVPPYKVDRQFALFRDHPTERVILKELNLDPVHLTDHMTLNNGGTRFTVESTLNPALQHYIMRLVHRARTLKSAVVVMDVHDGRVLAMVSYDREGNSGDLCLKADFPAASLFKVVSAAAAFESAGFRPGKTVYYRGKRHTLYKGQLKKRIGKYTCRTTFKRAFALSINPVFGKLGVYDLGRKTLEEYAGRFLFNRKIPFDFPVGMSTVHVPEEAFGLAEIASGFNKRTLISPLHAALVALVVANKGIMAAPWLIASIRNGSGQCLYQRRPAVLARCVAPRTAQNLKILMRDTVIRGTCRKSFLPLRRKRVFKNIELGAKTGTINDVSDRFKYDWLIAYALQGKRKRAICVAVLSVHSEKLGIRANELGRYIIGYYYTSRSCAPSVRICNGG